MATYRLYFMDPRDRIGRAVDLDAVDDHEAIRMAAAHDESVPIELWQGDRKICRFEARPAPLAPLPVPPA